MFSVGIVIMYTECIDLQYSRTIVENSLKECRSQWRIKGFEIQGVPLLGNFHFCAFVRSLNIKIQKYKYSEKQRGPFPNIPLNPPLDHNTDLLLSDIICPNESYCAEGTCAWRQHVYRTTWYTTWEASSGGREATRRMLCTLQKLTNDVD